MQDNPYAAPSSNLSGNDSYGQQQHIDQRVIYSMDRSKGWVRFLGILMVLLSLIFVAAGVFLTKESSLRNLVVRRIGVPIDTPIGTIAIVISFVVALFVFLYGFLMLRYAGSITKLTQSHSEQDFVKSITAQRSFFVYAGILSILGTLQAIVQLFKD